MRRTFHKYLLSSLCLLLSFSFSSCGEEESLESMNRNTNELLELTQTLRGNTENMYHQLRSQEAEELRDRNFRRLNRAGNFDEKLNRAVSYVQGFEFHLWTNDENGLDTDEYRQRLMADAVEELFRSLQTDIAEVKARSVSPSTNDNSALNLFSIAVSLHKINQAQHYMKFEKKSTLKKWSFLEMIKLALMNEKRVERGEIDLHEMPKWQQTILYRPWRETAISLLYLRFQMMPAIALGAINPDLRDSGFFSRLRHAIFNWNGKFDQLNLPTQRKILEDLSQAVEARKILHSLGHKVVLHETLARIFKKMNVHRCQERCLSSERGHLRQFRQYLETVLTGTEDDDSRRRGRHSRR